jgi:hypothetical protein
MSKRTILLSLMLLGAGSPFAYGQSPSATARRPPQLVVLSTVSDRTNATLTIRGVGFGDVAAQVWCQTYPLTVISWRDAEIVVHLPPALMDGSYLLTVARGQSEMDRGVFDMTVQGETTSAAGPKGDPGEAGPKGDPGEAGPNGDPRPAGPKGDTGADGPKGETGAAGPKGDTGAAGPQGERGLTGAQGETGATGPGGPEGPQGLQGVAGPTGPQGLQGVAGPEGPQGPQGVAGPIGPQGPAGVQGPMGLTGPQGPQGVPGVSGYQVVVTPLTTVSINGNQTTTLSAVCPAGKVAIGGGFDYSGNIAVAMPVASFPAAADTWRVMVRLNQVSGATFQGRAFALCASAP